MGKSDSIHEALDAMVRDVLRLYTKKELGDDDDFLELIGCMLKNISFGVCAFMIEREKYRNLDWKKEAKEYLKNLEE